MDVNLTEEDEDSKPSSALARELFILNCDSSTPIKTLVRYEEDENDRFYFSSNSVSDPGNKQEEDACSESYLSGYLPEFEEVLELEQKLDEMSSQKQKQFIFLHGIINSSSDDSQLDFSDDESCNSLSAAPAVEELGLYHFQLMETPIPLPELSYDDFSQFETQIRNLLMTPRPVSYSIPLALKHLLCTDDNLMGFEDNITLERIVRKKILADIIPMCSQGSRTFLPLQIDFSPTHIGQDNITNVSNFINKLSEKFQPRTNSFFNTKFQLSYTFEDGKYKITYGIFDDQDYFTPKAWNAGYIDLHVFSRYLSKDCFPTLEAHDRSSISESDHHEREWKSFIVMDDIFKLVDYMLKGKCSFIQSNSHLLKHIKGGGSLRSAADKYEMSVQKNKRRILSNVRKYVNGKKIVPIRNFTKLAAEGVIDKDFHCGLFDQVVGYYSDLGLQDFQKCEEMYVIELKHFEDVVKSIADKYVYEKYVHPVSFEAGW